MINGYVRFKLGAYRAMGRETNRNVTVDGRTYIIRIRYNKNGSIVTKVKIKGGK
jgi:hypothetical protein